MKKKNYFVISNLLDRSVPRKKAMGERAGRSLRAALGGLSLGALFSLGVPISQASVWTGANGNWSSTVSPGWTTGGVPNAQGAIADFSGSVTGTTTQDVSGGVTIGSFLLGSSSGGSRTITLTNGITFNQDGAGSGFATINNSSSANIRISIGSGTLTLADDLLISNTSGFTGAAGITMSSAFAGAGNMTISNASNSTTVNAITLTGVSTFAGSVLIQKGSVLLSNAGFGGSGNAVTLGSSGNGSATFLTQGSGTAIANPITVAANTGGTLLLGSNSAATTNSTFSGTLTLNDNVSLTSSKTGTAATVFSGVISGSGGVSSTGPITLSGANTYAGGTTISSGTLLANYNTVSVTASSTGTGAVSVTGGALGGTGRVLGTVTVSSGATLQGGDGTNATGMLTLVVNPTLSSGSNIALTLGTGNAHSTLALAAGGFNGFDANQIFTLGNLQTGTYDNIITGVASGISTGNWTITGLSPGSYSFTDDGTNIDLSITAVPEPGTWAIGMLAALAGAFVLRRRMAAR